MKRLNLFYCINNFLVCNYWFHSQLSQLIYACFYGIIGTKGIESMKNEIKIFEQNNIRSAYNEEQEKWYFSVVDLIAILTDSERPANYWKVLKNRLKKEGRQLVTNCNQLKIWLKYKKKILWRKIEFLHLISFKMASALFFLTLNVNDVFINIIDVKYKLELLNWRIYSEWY